MSGHCKLGDDCHCRFVDQQDCEHWATDTPPPVPPDGGGKEDEPAPRDLAHTWADYWVAPSGRGPLAAEWSDKPHRLIYDLVGGYRALLTRAETAERERDEARGAMAGERAPDGSLLWDVLEKDALNARISELEKEVERLGAKLNTPETADFMSGVMVEAPHQHERWGSDHDTGKTPFDWFWLVGYLAQKAAAAQVAGETNKALHHTISTAAALANWHAAISGTDTQMRPGIDPSERGVA